MLLMCLSILACWAALRVWQIYMQSVMPEEWIRFSEIEHRRRLAWADKIGDQGRKMVTRVIGLLSR